MTLRSLITRALFTLLIAAGLAPAAVAQTFVLNQTTLSAAQGATDSTIALTSAAAATGSTFGAVVVGQLISVDQELELVSGTTGTSTVFQVQRRNNRTTPQTTHPSGAVAYIGTTGSFYNVDPAIGACDVTKQGDPYVNIANGTIWRCTASIWANVVDAYMFLPAQYCQGSVSGNSTGTNGYTSVGTAPSLPVVQDATSGTGTNTHYYMCSLIPDTARLNPSRTLYLVDAEFYYGVQTTGLGTQVATLASGTMNSKIVFTSITYPVPGASETATGLAEAARVDAGTLLITPVVASSNVGTTTAGEFYSVKFTPATPIAVATDHQQILLTVSLLNTATSATVTNSPGVLVHYRVAQK